MNQVRRAGPVGTGAAVAAGMFHQFFRHHTGRVALLCLGVSLIAVLVAAEARAAEAQVATAAPSLPDLTAPRMVRLELGGMVLHEDDDYGDDIYTLFTTILSGQATLAGVTFFGALPVATAASSTYSETDLGNLSLGARHAHRSGGLVLGVSAAVLLPTSPSWDLFSRDEQGSAAAMAAFYQPERLADFLPDATTFRLATDLRFEGELHFAQAQLAYQRFRFERSDGNLGSVALAIGRRVGSHLVLVGEVDAVARLSTNLDSYRDDDGWWSLSGSVGVRMPLDRLALGARLYVPFKAYDQDARGAGLIFDAVSRF
jgi:hypothetical protein